jgi:hypothetical protein
MLFQALVVIWCFVICLNCVESACVCWKCDIISIFWQSKYKIGRLVRVCRGQYSMYMRIEGWASRVTMLARSRDLEVEGHGYRWHKSVAGPLNGRYRYQLYQLSIIGVCTNANAHFKRLRSLVFAWWSKDESSKSRLFCREIDKSMLKW